jgi:hypothetical protein
MSDFDLLCKILEHFGFKQAAVSISLHDVADVEKAIASWQRYPKCMDIYPTKLTKKGYK